VNSTLVFVNRLESRTKFHPECFASLQDTGVDFFLTSGAETCHKARFDALEQCLKWGYKYISWVDDDDLSVAGIFSRLQLLLEGNLEAAAACAQEQLFNELIGKKANTTGRVRKVVNGSTCHLPILFRTEILYKYYHCLLTPELRSPEHQLTRAMARDGYFFIQLDTVGRYWRQWDGQDHKNASNNVLNS
jgi:hypothetical protein